MQCLCVVAVYLRVQTQRLACPTCVLTHPPAHLDWVTESCSLLSPRHVQHESLQRYSQLFQLGDSPSTSSHDAPAAGGSPPPTKEDLLPAIARHWASMTIDEEDTLYRFAYALRKLGGGAAPSLGGVLDGGVRKGRGHASLMSATVR